MTPGEFAAKWRGVETGERASAQSHFLDLCRVLGQPGPTDADPTGTWYAFEKGAGKFGGGEGFADVWKRGFFALEYKGKGRDLHAALRQLVDYKDALENPPLLIVSDLATIEVHTNFTGLSPVTRVVTLDDLARPDPSDALAVLRAVFTAPEELRPTHEPAQITETAARHFAELAQALRSRGHDPQAVARELGPLVSGQTGHPSGRWWRGRNALALGTLALISGCSPAATATPAASTSPSAAGASAMATASTPASAQACPWYIAATVSAANAGLPDTAAAYWLEPFQVAPGLRIVVSGTFPDARYASLQVYDAKTAPFTSNGLSSALTDYQIAPDQGGVNPWQQQAAPGGHFSVTLREDVAPGQVNTLPLAPLGTTSGQGYLEYRVYLPAGGDFSKLTAPTLTLEPGGLSASLAPCATRTSPSTAPASTPSSGPTATPAAPSPSAKTRAVGQLEFFREAFDVGTPNADAAYVLAYLTPPGPADVVVIHAKAPTYPPGDHPSPWPAANTDVRYWSMCVGLATAGLPTVVNPLPGGGTDPGCRADAQTKLNAAGEYAYVLGTEAQRATIEGVPGATFLSFSAAQPSATHILMFRELLASSSFTYSPQQVTQINDPAATAAAMGPTYPRAAICPLSTLVAAGVAGCTK